MTTIYLLLVLIFCDTNIQINGMNDGVNEGASTSAQLTECEECELRGYAERVVNFMIAEDQGDISLEEMLHRNFNELQAFHDEIFSIILYAEVGARDFLETTPRHQQERIRFFKLSINRIFLDLMHKTCERHYRRKLKLRYNEDSNTVTVDEEMSVLTDDCLCKNDPEKVIISESLPLDPTGEPKKFSKVSSTNSYTPGIPSWIITSRHPIIPMALIVKFFQTWLSDDLTAYSHTEDFNACILMILARLKRSLEKLLIVRVRNSREFTNDWYDLGTNTESVAIGENFSQFMGQAFGWMDGNLFEGPRHRGPFDPEFQRDEEESLGAFEFEAKNIIMPQQYKDLLDLCQKLLAYVRTSPQISLLKRLLKGFHLFTTMTNTFSSYRLTRMNIDQWEERVPSSTDLDRVINEKLKREMKTQLYWAIKKKSDRFPRSAEFFDAIPKIQPNLLQSNQWSVFIRDSMIISMDKHSLNEPCIWSCDLSRLYDLYLFQEEEKDVSNNECSSCLTFDEFLYSKISRSNAWQECNDFSSITDLAVSSPWCLAWRNIVKDLLSTTNSTDNDNVDYSLRSESYLKNLEIVLGWLSSKLLNLKNCSKKEVVHDRPEVQFKSNPFALSTNNSVDIGFCYMTTLVSTLVFWKNDCKKALG